MGYDDVLVQIGNVSPYQRRVLLVFFLPAIACACHTMGGVFLMAIADFRCLLPYENPDNATYYSPPLNITSISNRWNEETKTWPQCERHDPAGIVDPQDFHFGRNQTSDIPNVKCDSFVYDKTYYTQTVTTEWNLVCNHAWLKTLSESLYMLGDVPGSIICGALSDRYGRKSALLWGSIMQLIVALLVFVSPNFYAYVIFRMLVGTTAGSLYLVGYVAAVEMVGPQHRTTVGVVGNLVFTAGYMLSAGFAYFIRKWRYLQIALTIPIALFLVFWWSVPESARWLLTTGRVQEARDVLAKISSENGMELSSDKFDGLLSKNDNSEPAVIERHSVIHLLKYPNLRRKSLSLFFIWFTSSVTYYGLSWNTSNLGGNDYVNFGIAAFVEVPAYLVLLFTLDTWGRKNNVSSGMLLSGISLLLTYFVPSGMSWLTITLTMLGKFAITYSWGATYVFTAELYPTVVRNIGLAACTVFSNIGSTLAPQISYLFNISTYLPLVVLGTCSLIAGLLALRLPETSNTKLPETIEDGEKPAEYRSNTRQLACQLTDIDCT